MTEPDEKQFQLNMYQALLRAHDLEEVGIADMHISDETWIKRDQTRIHLHRKIIQLERELGLL